MRLGQDQILEAVKAWNVSMQYYVMAGLQNSRMTYIWHKRSVLLSQYFKFTICCQCYKVVAPAERSKVMASYIQNHLLDDFHMPKL